MPVTRMGKTIIDQNNDPPICLGANDPTGRLQHPVETWILVSISKTIAALVIKILLEQVSFQPQLWHPYTNHHDTDQPLAHQVNPLAKDTTHDGKPNQCFLVVGVGVPQLGLERDLLKEYFDRQGDNGFAYAYQYPGFNRVLQATGRVIRTETDRGIVVLIDDRFIHTRYRQLFPSHWRGYQVVTGTIEMKDKLLRFWSRD